MSVTKKALYNAGTSLVVTAEETSIDVKANISHVKVTISIETTTFFHSIQPVKTFIIESTNGWDNVYDKFTIGTIGPISKGQHHVVYNGTYNLNHRTDGSCEPFDIKVTGIINSSLPDKYNGYRYYWFGTQEVSLSLPTSQWTNYGDSDIAKISKIRVAGKELPASNSSKIPIGSPSISFDLVNLRFDTFDYYYKIWTTSGGSNARWERYELARGQTTIVDQIVDPSNPSYTRWYDYTSYSATEYWITLVTVDKSGRQVGEFALVPKLIWDSPVRKPSIDNIVNMQSDRNIVLTVPRLEASPVYHIEVYNVEFVGDNNSVIDELGGKRLVASVNNLRGDTTLNIPIPEDYRNLFKRNVRTFSGERSFKVYYKYSIDGPGGVHTSEVEGRYTLADATINVNTSKGEPRLIDINNTVKGITGNERIIVAGKSNIKCIIPSDLFSSSDANDAVINRISVQIGNITADANIESNRVTGWGGNPLTEITFNNSSALSSAPNSYTITAYNSKGKQLSKSYGCEIIPYSAPRINYNARRSGDNVFVMNRANDDNSKPFISPVVVGGSNKNSVSSLTINYKIDTGQWVNITNRFGSSSADGNGRINLNPSVTIDGGNTIRRESQIAIELVLIDSFGGRSQQNISVPSWKPLIHIDGNRSGVAINSMYPNDVTNGWLFSDTGFATKNYVLSGKNWSFNDNYSREGIHQSYGDNFNNISFDNFKAGWFYWTNTTANKPTGNSNSWGNFLVTGVSNDHNNASWIHILAFDTDGNVYIRRRINRYGWSNWDKLSIGQIDLSGYTTTAVTNTLAGRVDTLEGYKSSMAWLHGKLTETGGPKKENIRLKSIESKKYVVVGDNVLMGDITEEGNFWYDKNIVDSHSEGYVGFNGHLSNKYAPEGIDNTLQTFIEENGKKIFLRTKNGKTWGTWKEILHTDVLSLKNDYVTLLNGWNAYESDHPLVRRVGGIISVTGQITRGSAADLSKPFMNLPSWARPRRDIGVRIVTSPTAHWYDCVTCHCLIKTNGDVYKAGGEMYYAWCDIQFSFSL